MTIRRVGILGGGPAGLYAARLLKLGQPSLDVTVYERNDPADTFGFGVALTGATLRNLSAADPDSCAAIQALGVPLEGQEFRLPQGRVAIEGSRSLGIGRAALLRTLLTHAEEVGVAFEVGHRDPDDVDGDVVLACDGVNSAARVALASHLGARRDVGRELYLWCGADVTLPNVFMPVTTEHGAFTAHSYAYAPGHSTVLIETDEATWRAAGFDQTTAALDGERSGASDDVSLQYLEEAFAAHLDGAHLLGNRSRWLRFQTISCSRWHHGRTVLLGDAAHTAHYSLGSGTKLAMEDAIVLAGCLQSSADLETALTEYETARRPVVTRLQRLARRSQLWWESFPRRAATLSPAQTAVAYMTRAGNVSLDQLAATNSSLVSPAHPVADVLAEPLVWKGRRFASRVLPDTSPHRFAALSTDVADPWGPPGDNVVVSARQLLAAGADGLRLADSTCGDRHALLDRLALAERLRIETGALVAVEGAVDFQADLAAGLAAGRCDLVATTPTHHRIGLVVPSSNVTVETEMPALLGRHETARFSFHASRMRMLSVSAQELAAMNAQRARCVDELADAGVDALLYGCLVAIMAQAPDEHRRVDAAVAAQLGDRHVPAQVASSAGALVEALHVLEASRIALVTPYMRPLAEKVVAYLRGQGFTVADWRALEVADNAEVGRIPGERVMDAARSLDLAGVDALVISACVQMPSLGLVAPAEDEFGLPVLSAATAAAFALLTRLGLPAVLPRAGSLLSGRRLTAGTRSVLVKEAS